MIRRRDEPWRPLVWLGDPIPVARSETRVVGYDPAVLPVLPPWLAEAIERQQED